MTTDAHHDGLPSFDELPELENIGVRHAWDVWGRDDELGSINLVTPSRVARAATLVRTGEVISLDLPLDQPNPPLFGRKAYEHHVFALNRNEMDDRLDGFHLQASTQWDALCHVRAREHGYWGGRHQDPTEGPNGLGIDRWAEHGIAGRGVLIDLDAWRAGLRSAGAEGGYDALQPHAFSAADVQAALDAQGTTLLPGDILCLRFGWTTAYRGLDAAGRVAYAEGPTFAGLRAGQDEARFIWNAHPAALCADNPAVEVVPGDASVGSLHRRLLPTLGMALGEMFDFDTLAQRCGALGRYEFFFVAAPLKVPNGLGSPGNAVAIL
ncbi:MAG: cyclase family protein [Acidimicrobiales bacterium]